MAPGVGCNADWRVIDPCSSSLNLSFILSCFEKKSVYHQLWVYLFFLSQNEENFKLANSSTPLAPLECWTHVSCASAVWICCIAVSCVRTPGVSRERTPRALLSWGESSLRAPGGLDGLRGFWRLVRILFPIEPEKSGALKLFVDFYVVWPSLRFMVASPEFPSGDPRTHQQSVTSSPLRVYCVGVEAESWDSFLNASFLFLHFTLSKSALRTKQSSLFCTFKCKSTLN